MLTLTRMDTRWLISRDMPAVLSIDAVTLGLGWGEAAILDFLRHNNSIGMVAEVGETVEAAVIYELRKKSLRVGFLGGTARGVDALLSKLAGELSCHRRTWLEVVAHEEDLRLCTILKAHGHRATGVLRGRFGDRDGIRFVYEHAED
jgi:hypothetical protein